METISILLVAFTLFCVIYLERVRQPTVRRLLEWVPAILFAYIVPAIVTHLFRLDLSGVALHRVSKEVIMPLAIVFVMSALSFRQLRAVGIRPIAVFLSGSAAVALMPFVLLWGLSAFSERFSAVIIDAEYWRGMVTMVGSWIGGSTSQLVLKELSGCPEGLFLVILVMDNVLVNIWTILMFQKIKRSDAVNRFFGIADKPVDLVPDEVRFGKHGLRTALLTIGICLVAVAICYFSLDSFLLKVVILSLTGLFLGNFIRWWNHALLIKGGGYLIILIMAILGLKLNFGNFSLPWTVLAFSIAWLISHYLVMMAVAYLLRLNMAWVPIASMANVGGISTAPAVTKAYNEEWMPHAILLAILSMVTGTYWGMLTIYLFEWWY
ncbi:MAG: DUF819 family protein [Saprospiraceae bacterium]|nr:DUF819 family protein [Saprospiraceae bacterium]